MESIKPKDLFSMNIKQAINELLNGAELNDVVEDLTKDAAHHAAAMVRWNGMSKEEAAKKAKELFGEPVDDDLFHAATSEHGIGKPKGKEAPGQHWVDADMWNIKNVRTR